jgi:hypothetical protein
MIKERPCQEEECEKEDGEKSRKKEGEEGMEVEEGTVVKDDSAL